MAQSAMFSTAWFNAFAAAIPASTTSTDVDGITRLAPPSEFSRLIDIGCGIGRTTGACRARGYQVTGIDQNVDALARARRATPGGRFVALDYRCVGHMRWTFDVATILWNSLGFATRVDDLEALRGVARILRPGGRLLLDLYHPDWLAAHELSAVVDASGTTVDRWLHEGRSCHRFRYADGSADDIQFNVYRPGEMTDLLGQAGLRAEALLVWWKAGLAATAEHARYQIMASRPPASPTA